MLFGEHLRALRKEKGLTQRTLAEEVDVNHTYISKMERNQLERLPSEKTIRRLASALQVSAYDLLNLAGKMPPGLKTIIDDNPQAMELLWILSEQRLSKETYTLMLTLAQAELGRDLSINGRTEKGR